MPPLASPRHAPVSDGKQPCKRMCDSSMKQSRVRRFRAGLVFIVLAGLAVAATCAPRLGAAGEPSAVTVLPWGPTPSAAFAYARATAIAAVGRALFNDP